MPPGGMVRQCLPSAVGAQRRGECVAFAHDRLNCRDCAPICVPPDHLQGGSIAVQEVSILPLTCDGEASVIQVDGSTVDGSTSTRNG